MPAIEVLQRAFRDLAALSAAPLLWKDLDEDSVAESLASTLVTMLDADFVYISIPTLAVAVEMACGPEGRVPVPLIPTLRASLHASLANSSGKIVSPLSGDPVNVLSTPLEFMPGAILIVASKRSDYPTEIDTVIQRIAAAQVTTVLQQRQNLTAAGYLAKLINLSSDFFGVVDLGGVPLFVNPAGLEHVGMASIQEALEHRFADFLEIDDRDRARYEIWPTILSDGRWSGQLSFLNAKTGAATPFYFECFRIDVPPTGPVAVGTISRSVNARNRSKVFRTIHQDSR